VNIKKGNFSNFDDIVSWLDRITQNKVVVTFSCIQRVYINISMNLCTRARLDKSMQIYKLRKSKHNSLHPCPCLDTNVKHAVGPQLTWGIGGGIWVDKGGKWMGRAG
jgi:hypothetical protein